MLYRLERWMVVRPVTTRSILLVNRIIHNEAEEVLWTKAKLTLEVLHHYTYDVRTSPRVTLSPYAYSRLRYLTLELKVNEKPKNTCGCIGADDNTIIGRKYCRTCGTWEFYGLGRQLTNLKHVTFNIADGYPGIPAIDTWRRYEAIGCILGIIGSFPVEDKLVVVYGNDSLYEDLCNCLAYWKDVEIQSEEAPAWEAWMDDVD